MGIRNNSDGKWRGRLIRYAPIVLWAGVVLFLSTSQGSSMQTSRFIRPIIEFFFPNASPDVFLFVHAAIRKSAHFIEYAVLALFSARAAFSSSKNTLNRNALLFSLAVVVIVAVIDETNQSLESDRTGSVWDILLDLSGGLAACLCILVTSKFRTYRARSGNFRSGN